MKRRSLRTELRLWSALLVAAILVVVAAGVAFYQQHMEVAELDYQMKLIADHFLTVYQKNGTDPAWITRRNVESTIAETGSKEWFIEVADSAGNPLFRSDSLSGLSFAGAPSGLSDFDLGDAGIRAGVFSGKGITLRVGMDLDGLDELSSSPLVAVAVVLPAVLALLYFGAKWLAGRALAPVEVLAAAAERVSAQNPMERLPVLPPADELSRLAAVLNATFDRLATAYQQATRFSADASHEFRTPLAVARSGLERVLGSGSLTPADRANVTEALDQLRRINHITRTLLILSRADAGQLGLNSETGDLAKLVSGCAEDAQILAEERGISLVMETTGPVLASFEAERTTMILQNLLENAVNHNVDGGQIRIRVCENPLSRSVEISNTGPGIPEIYQSQLFARFFRAGAAPESSGHGLGLSIARELARAQGGEVTFGGGANGWTRFTLDFPAD